MTETYLAQMLSAVNGESKYDSFVKSLLADKQILAWILKYTLKEFGDMEIVEIISAIGTDIEVGTRPVDPGLSNLGKVKGTSTEDNVPHEGTVCYDIRFTVYHQRYEMKFLIDVEPQKSTDPSKLGYHLEYRIVFYLARMISAQKHTEFYHSAYDSLKNVRSIWICMDEKEDGDAIEEIGLMRKYVFGGEESTRELDLMKGIIIHLRDGEGLEESRNPLIALLEKLFSRRSADEKKRILMEEYGMVMTEELEGGLRQMCNWSENMIERGVRIGRKEERIFTEQERQRADRAEAEVQRLQEELEYYKNIASRIVTV